jgi:DNA polymerase-3 subunit alpha
MSYLKNDNLSDPHLDLKELFNITDGISLFTGTINGLFGQLFNKGKFTEIAELYSKLKSKYNDRFYIEIQRHGDQNEIGFEKFNLSKSLDLEIPVIATNEVFYINKDMHEAHDALICIKNKTYINEKNRLIYSDQHYLKNDSEMSELFADLPEALENNYNFSYRCSFRPLFSKPILPNISSEKEGNADEILKKNSLEGLNEKFQKFFKLENNELSSNGSI